MSYESKSTPIIYNCCYIYIYITKYSYLSIYDDHGLMMICDIHMHFNYYITKTNNGLKYVSTIFNTNYLYHMCL